MTLAYKMTFDISAFSGIVSGSLDFKIWMPTAADPLPTPVL